MLETAQRNPQKVVWRCLTCVFIYDALYSLKTSKTSKRGLCLSQDKAAGPLKEVFDRSAGILLVNRTVCAWWQSSNSSGRTPPALSLLH